MKNIILILTIVCSSCATIEKSGYTRMNNLNLTQKERFKLHWTEKDTSFARYDYRCECYYYKIDFDYSFIDSLTIK